MMDIKWREGYNAELKSLTDHHGKFYSKTKSNRQFRCQEAIDKVIEDYAKHSPIVRSFSTKGEFDAALKRAKRKYRK